LKLIIINGPNLNMLGDREPEIYGNQTFDDYLKELQACFPTLQIAYYQSNVEGEIINYLQQMPETNALIINLGGYTHTSVAIADALAIVKCPIIEVHISNLYKREDFRHNSLSAKHCIGLISGFGLKGYKMAVQYLIDNI
jgi:3-dehydroquinate dehydratase II